ncbi:hypothetical protein K1719_036572 [Acacia pycnantha]|nr:hypothetical protein K1719_036572 [Acacia pycnantha]
MEMKKLALAVVLAAASLTAVVAEAEVPAPAPGPSSGAAALSSFFEEEKEVCRDELWKEELRDEEGGSEIWLKSLVRILGFILLLVWFDDCNVPSTGWDPRRRRISQFSIDKEDTNSDRSSPASKAECARLRETGSGLS